MNINPTLENTRLRPPAKSLKLDNVRLWVDGLRRFRKARGFLARFVGAQWAYCALGAACEVSPAIAAPMKPDYYGAVRRKAYGASKETAGLPPEVARWLGLPRSYGYGVPVIVTSNGRTFRTFSVMDLNDRFGWSLNKIADLIERDWLGGVAK